MIIVTGYSGFVGTNLRFMGDQNIIYLGRRNPTEINDRDQWINSPQPDDWAESLPFDCNGATLVHLAWAARGDYLINPINELWLNSSKKLFDSFKNKGGKRFLSLGTSLETAPFQRTFGDTPYVKSKMEFRNYVISSGSVKSSWIIPHTLFGKFEDSRRLVPTVINTLLGNGEIILKNPEESRDFTPVNKLVNMINNIIEKDLEGIFECKTGIENDVKTFVNHLSDLFKTGNVGKPIEGIESEIRETIHYWKSMQNLS